MEYYKQHKLAIKAVLNLTVDEALPPQPYRDGFYWSWFTTFH